MKRLTILVAILMVSMLSMAQTEYNSSRYIKFTENASGEFISGKTHYVGRTFAFYAPNNNDISISSKLFLRRVEGGYVFEGSDPDNKNAIGSWYISYKTTGGDLYIYIDDGKEFPYLYVADDYINVWEDASNYYRYYLDK